MGALPAQFNAFQTFLISHRLMTHRVTLEEAVQNAPTGTGGNAVGTVLVAISSVIGGVFGLITILILSFYLLIEARVDVRLPHALRAGGAARATCHGGASERDEGERVARRAVHAGRRDGHVRRDRLGLMGVPYFYVIALVAAIGETIPIVGPVIGGVTAVAVALTVSPKLALMVGDLLPRAPPARGERAGAEDHGAQVGVSPVAVMVALLIGGVADGAGRRDSRHPDRRHPLGDRRRGRGRPGKARLQRIK